MKRKGPMKTTVQNLTSFSDVGPNIIPSNSPILISTEALAPNILSCSLGKENGGRKLPKSMLLNVAEDKSGLPAAARLWQGRKRNKE